MRCALTSPGYLAGLTRDEGKLFLLRATMLGAFYPNLLRGACRAVPAVLAVRGVGWRSF